MTEGRWFSDVYGIGEGTIRAWWLPKFHWIIASSRNGNGSHSMSRKGVAGEIGRSLRAPGHFQFLKDESDIVLHRLVAQVEREADFFIRFPLGHESEYPLLLSGEGRP